MNKNSSQIFSSSSTSLKRGKRNLWLWLVEPVTSITEVGQRRQASLVSAILLVMVIAMSIGIAVNTFVLINFNVARILAGSLTMMGIGYILSRTRHYRLAVPVLLVTLVTIPILSVSLGRIFSSEGLLTNLIFNILMILICSTLLSTRTTVFFAIGNVLGLLLLPVFIPAIPFGNMAMPLVFNGIVSSFILIMTQHRNLMEKDRLLEIAQINRSLETSNTELNTRTRALNDRTRGLNLAIEVGRSASQLRALNIMLKDSCELIQKVFDLYYVQVYLIDPALTTLQLNAGTGEVGAQLLERGHSLPVNTSSINGRAAFEKRSVVIADTALSATFHPNPLLPDTRSEMAVPLIVAEKVVGVLDMQARDPGALSEEALPAFEALAGQLAVAIQNATLLAEAQQARVEVEAQARRLARTGWDEYLDAIHKPEHIGFVFDRNELTPLEATEDTQLTEGSQAVTAPISLTGEALGSLVVEIEDNTKSEQTAELVNIVARQVAQQIENLRLLESAERYRYEAEQAARRQTREGWQGYVNSRTGENLAFLYDLTEVRPYKNGLEINESALRLPLKVRDETIGKLTVDGLTPDDKDSLELANAVAERLGAHIESLRQYDQTQSALAQSEKLFNASRLLTQATDLQELVAATVNTLGIPEVNRAVLTTFGYDSAGEIEQLTIIANWWNETGHEITPIGTRYPLEVIRAMPMFVSPVPVFFNDTFHDERLDATTMGLVKKLNLRAVAVLPLHTGSQQIGALILEAEEPHNFTPDETRLFSSLAPQIATVLENRQQYERAQHQAEREAMLNVINQKIQSATSVEAVLQIAARELGHALHAPMTIAQLSMKDRN